MRQKSEYFSRPPVCHTGIEPGTSGIAHGDRRARRNILISLPLLSPTNKRALTHVLIGIESKFQRKAKHNILAQCNN